MHTCNTSFASWVYPVESLDIWNNMTQLGPLLSENYVPNQQWDLMDVQEISEVIGYSCCDNSEDLAFFKHVKYSITVKRKVAFIVLMLIIPAVLLCLLTPIVFWLPPDSTEKITIG